MINAPSQIITRNWHKKLLSLVFAIFIWFFAGQSVTATRTVKDIPVRIVGLSPDQTVLGLQSDGILEKKMTLTITGNVAVIEHLRPANLEIVISATGHNSSWIAKIDKYNLVYLDKDIKIQKNIHAVVTDDIFIGLTEFVTDDITIHIMPPIGRAPAGYEYLDVWPKQLVQKISGPKEYVQSLKEQGLELTFNLNKVSYAEVERNQIAQQNHDEIIVPIPNDWKKIKLPFWRTDTVETLNDPQAEFLRFLFLKKELQPLDLHLPVLLFFPIDNVSNMSPLSYTIEASPPIVFNHGVYQMNVPLYAKYVSKRFLDVVKNNMAISIVVSSDPNNQTLNWSTEFIDEKTLEDTFVQTIIEQEYGVLHNFNLIDETSIRHRFREYLRKLTLYDENRAPLTLSAKIEKNKVVIRTKHKDGNNEQRTTNNEQRTTNNEQRTTNNEQ